MRTGDETQSSPFRRAKRRQWAYVTLQTRGADDAGDTHVDAVVAGLRRSGRKVELVSIGISRHLVIRAVSSIVAQARVSLRLSRFEVVVVRMHPLAIITVAACRLRDVPVIVEVNGVSTDYTVAHPVLERLRRPLQWLIHRQLRDASAVVAVTAGLARWVSRTTGRTTRIDVIPNAADAGTFRPGLVKPTDAPERYALFLGSLSPWQGIEQCLGAVNDPAWPSDVVLLIIGDGAMAPVVRRAEASDRQRVRWLGRRIPEEVPAYLSNALLSLALKNYHAPEQGQSPLKVYESMSCGVPVVGTTMHGMEPVTEHGAGVLLDDPSPSEVARTVARLADDAEARSAMGGRGREAILDGNTWDHRISQIVQIVSEFDES